MSFASPVEALRADRRLFVRPTIADPFSEAKPIERNAYNELVVPTHWAVNIQDEIRFIYDPVNQRPIVPYRDADASTLRRNLATNEIETTVRRYSRGLSKCGATHSKKLLATLLSRMCFNQLLEMEHNEHHILFLHDANKVDKKEMRYAWDDGADLIAAVDRKFWRTELNAVTDERLSSSKRISISQQGYDDDYKTALKGELPDEYKGNPDYEHSGIPYAQLFGYADSNLWLIGMSKESHVGLGVYTDTLYSRLNLARVAQQHQNVFGRQELWVIRALHESYPYTLDKIQADLREAASLPSTDPARQLLDRYGMTAFVDAAEVPAMAPTAPPAPASLGSFSSSSSSPKSSAPSTPTKTPPRAAVKKPPSPPSVERRRPRYLDQPKDTPLRNDFFTQVLYRKNRDLLETQLREYLARRPFDFSGDKPEMGRDLQVFYKFLNDHVPRLLENKSEDATLKLCGYLLVLKALNERVINDVTVRGCAYDKFMEAIRLSCMISKHQRNLFGKPSTYFGCDYKGKHRPGFGKLRFESYDNFNTAVHGDGKGVEVAYRTVTNFKELQSAMRDYESEMNKPRSIMY